jgi:hypothetical protein
VRLAAAALAALAAAGCASAPVTPPADAGPTRGLAMRLWWARTDTRQYEYFVVGADGSLAYGGGMRAFERQTEWTGRLTDDEGARLRAIVDAAGWLTAAEPSVGPDQAVDRAVELLGAACKRRFDRFMQRLPEAGVQKR